MRAASVALVVAVAAMLTSTASAAPRTVATSPEPIIAFALDGTSYAWATGSCPFVAIVRGSSREEFEAPRCGVDAGTKLAVTRGQALWSSVDGGPSYEVGMHSAALDDSEATEVEQVLSLLGVEGDILTSLAGGAGVLAYSTVEVVEVSDDCQIQKQPMCEWAISDGSLRRVTNGSPVELAAAPPAALLAVARGLVAIAPAELSWTGLPAPPRAAPDTPIEVRDVATGALVSTYTPAGRVLGMAMTKMRLALLIVDSNGRKRVEVASTRTGARLRSVKVSRSTASAIALAGHRVAYSVGRSVRVLDLNAKKSQTLARSRGLPIGISIRKRSVYWAENVGRGAQRHGRVRASTAPRRVS